MKSALIRVLRKPNGRETETGGVGTAVMCERGRVGGLVRWLAAGGPNVGLARKARSESPSSGRTRRFQEPHDTRASLTHYQRV